MALESKAATLADQAGFPHRGWTLIKEIDTGLSRRIFRRHGPQYERCEYCGNPRVRYLFILRHPHWSEEISVGGNCASHLTEQPDLKTRGQDNAKKRSRLENFLNAKGWKRSSKGNLYIKYRNHHIVIFQDQRSTDKYKIKIDDEFGFMNYPSIEQAKHRAFEVIEQMNKK